MRAGTDGAEERRMRVLARLGAEFGRIVSREELHRAIARLLRDEAGYDGVAIWRSEDGADALVLGASEGLAPAGPGFAGEAATQLIVPLVSHGQPIGALGVRTNDPCVLDEADALLLDSVAPAIAAACEVASLHETLREAALTDAPTGLPNARGFGHALAQEVARSRRHGYRFALALVAVDGTQALRELDGRLAGDAALRAVGAALRSHLRGADIVARYGSEDFAVLLPQSSRSDAAGALERALSATSIETSYGVAEFSTDGSEPSALLAAADRQLRASRRIQTRA